MISVRNARARSTASLAPLSGTLRLSAEIARARADENGAGDRGRTGGAQLKRGNEAGEPGKPEDGNP